MLEGAIGRPATGTGTLRTPFDCISRLLARRGEPVAFAYRGVAAPGGGTADFAVCAGPAGPRMAVCGPRGAGAADADVARLAAVAARMSWRAACEWGADLSRAPVDAYLYRSFPGGRLAVERIGDIAGQETGARHGR